MVAKLTCAILGLLVAAGITLGAQQKPMMAQTAKEPECKCAIFPWTPEMCVKQCTSRMLDTWSTDKLATTLKLPSNVKDSVGAVKSSPASRDKIDKFLLSDDGKLFLKALDQAPKKDLKMLAIEKSTSSPER
jgi:hypothetical protein